MLHVPAVSSCSQSRLKCSWGSFKGSSRAEPVGTCRAAAAAERGTGEKAAGDRFPFGRRMLPLHVQLVTVMYHAKIRLCDLLLEGLIFFCTG